MGRENLMSADWDGVGMTSQRSRDNLISQLSSQGIKSPEVLQVMSRIPRHLFVDEGLANRAYENTALPIGHKQTISQPYIVARMTEAILSTHNRIDKVLEIGTGCGYQAVIIAQFANKVYTVERIDALLRQTRERLYTMKCQNEQQADIQLNNIHSRLADGYLGWAQHAPYDGIIVSAAAKDIPSVLVDQLVVGGRLVAPIGEQRQQLLLVTKTPTGYEQQNLNEVSFVPMLDGVIGK